MRGDNAWGDRPVFAGDRRRQQSFAQRRIHGRFGMDARRIINRHRAVIGTNEKTDLGAPENHPLGTPFHQVFDNPGIPLKKRISTATKARGNITQSNRYPAIS